MASQIPFQLPKIDFTDLQPGTAAWDATREEVTAALAAWGCFEAVYDRVAPDLRTALFGGAMDEVFGLPLETKMKNASSDVPYEGYIGGIPDLAYESLRVDNAPLLDGAESFTRLMWPDGNPTFRNTVWTFAKLMQDLEQMVERMILQDLGIEKHYDSHMESIKYALRLSYYGVPLNQETKIALDAHTDPTLLTIVGQQRVGGLEVQARNGEWIKVVPSPNSFIVMVGESFRAWANGRFKAPLHRVKIEANEKRYSTVFGSRPKKGYLVQTPEELVDEKNPLLFKPYDYSAYVRFRFSEEGKKAKDALMAYCGATHEETKA